LILWALALVIFVMNLGYSIVIPILPEMLTGLGVSKETLLLGDGLFFSGFNLVKIISQVPAGSISDRFGERRSVMASTGLYVLSLVLLIHASDFTGFYVARLIEGLATGVSYPAVVAIVMRSSSPDRLGRNMSWQVFAGGLGFVLGPVICAAVAENSRFGLTRDIYRPLWFMLWLTAIGGVLALIAFVLTPPVKREHERVKLTPTEEAKIDASEGLLAPQPIAQVRATSKGSIMGTVKEETGTLWRFLTSWPLHYFVAPLLVAKMIITAMLGVLPFHGLALTAGNPDGPDKDFASYLLVILGFTIALCQPIAGWLSDRVPARRLVFANLIGMTGGLAALSFVSSPQVFAAFFFIYCAFASALLTVSMKLVTELYHDKDGRGRAAGVVLSVSDVGTVIGPILFTHLYDRGPGLSFLSMAAASGVAIVLFWLSTGREKDLPQV
jgi:MFS family permease